MKAILAIQERRPTRLFRGKLKLDRRLNLYTIGVMSNEPKDYEEVDYLPTLPKSGGTIVGGRWVSRAELDKVLARMRVRIAELKKIIADRKVGESN